MSIKSENVTIKKIENRKNNFAILSENKDKGVGEKKQMSRVVDKILISGLQRFKQYDKLNPIDIIINDTQIISSLSKYGKYRLKTISFFISTSFNQTTDVMLITSNRLNDAKKALVNGKIHNILGIINVTEETNFNLINKTSR